jgi:DNA-binding MarR family transcriptional regulator
VESRADPSDGRITLLSLTPTGIDAARAVRRIEQDLYSAFSTIVSERQVQAAIPVLRALVDRLPTGAALQRRIADKATTTAD